MTETQTNSVKMDKGAAHVEDLPKPSSRWFTPSHHNFNKNTTQVLKGMLAVGIVMFHLVHYGHIPYLYKMFQGTGGPIVAVFFFISGYGCLYSLSKQGHKYLDTFLSKRIVHLLLPFACAVLLFQLTVYVFGQSRHPLQIAADVLTGNFGVLLLFCWFVFAILYFYLTFFITFRYLTNNIPFGLTLLVLFAVFYTACVRELGWSNIWYRCVLCFAVGSIWQYNEPLILRFIGSKLRLCLTLILLCGLWYCSKLLFQSALPAAWIFELIKMTFTPIAVILFLYHTGLPRWKPLLYLGSISYEIYLLQGIPIYVLPMFVPRNLWYVVLTLVITITLAAVLHWFLNRGVKRKPAV